MHRTPFWRRIPLRAQGIILNSLPMIAVLFTAGFAYFSNQQRERTEISMSRHFEMVENMVDLQTALAATEADLRGELLTRGGDFSKSYEAARALIPQKLEHIRTIMQSIPNPDRRMQKLSSLDRIQSLVSGQMDVLDALKKGGAGAGETQALPGAGVSAEIARNEPLMNEAWTLLGNLRLGEQRLLSKRMEEVRLVRHRDYLLIFLSVLAGLGSRAIAMYFFHKRVVRRVRQLTENARSLRDGSLLVHEPSDHADEIGELERELARIGDYIAGRRIDP